MFQALADKTHLQVNEGGKYVSEHGVKFVAGAPFNEVMVAFAQYSLSSAARSCWAIRELLHSVAASSMVDSVNFVMLISNDFRDP